MSKATENDTKRSVFNLAMKIIQVKDSIPWVRCASGNVLRKYLVNISPIIEAKTEFVESRLKLGLRT